MRTQLDRSITWGQLTHVNHDKVWGVIRHVHREGLLLLLSRAVKYVPVSELEAVFSQHAHPNQVGDVEEPETTALLQQAREFVESALRGDFYQDFVVNSRNCTHKSGKTQEFEARLNLMFDRLIAEAKLTTATDICAAYELILALLRAIDKFDRDIVFFADEGGTWQFSIDWKRVLPPYFRCLAEIHDWQEFERRALAAIDEFVDSWAKDELKAMVVQEVARPER